MSGNAEDIDRLVRMHIYEVTLKRGFPPTQAETARDLMLSRRQVTAAFQRLAVAHMIVQQLESGEILMANPFSAVPTAFLVETEAYSCYSNCIWDALGIPAMLKVKARIKASCADCGSAVELEIVDGSLQDAQGLIHFAVPAIHWWDDIVFT